MAWMASATSISVSSLQVVKLNKTITIKWLFATILLCFHSCSVKVHCMVCYIALTVIVATPNNQASCSSVSFSDPLPLSHLCKHKQG
jgi:hypothetical protein